MPALCRNEDEISRREDDVVRRRVSEIGKLVEVGIFYIHRAEISLSVTPRARRRGAIHVRRVLLEEDSHQFESGDLWMERKSAATSVGSQSSPSLSSGADETRGENVERCVGRRP